MNMFQETMTRVANAYYGRLNRYTSELDNRRNIDEECGYLINPTADQLHDNYIKDPYAARVVELYPKESWQVHPTVYETEKKSSTQFEDEWDEMCSKFDGSLGLMKGDQQSLLWSTIYDAHVLSRIGSYGVLLFGIDDGKKLDEPADVVKKKSRNLLFLRPFPETMAQVAEVERNTKSPRYGRPTFYNVMFADSREGLSGTGYLGASLSTQRVHWSRMLHLKEGIGTSLIAGTPAQRPVLAPLQNLRKVAGGSAEMFWKGGFNGTFFGTQPQLGGDVTVDMEGFKDQMELWENGLQRWLLGRGLTAQNLSPNIADPMNHILIQIEAICIQLGCPKRIFMGSERGELASSQDDIAWNDRLKQYQRTYITPKIIMPLIERLIMLGVLSMPKEVYVDWPDLTSQSKGEKADIAGKRVTAIQTYIAGGCDAVMPVETFLTHELDFTDEEAEAMKKAVEKNQQEQADKDAEMMAQGLDPATGQPVQTGDPNADPNAQDQFDGQDQNTPQPPATGQDALNPGDQQDFGVGVEQPDEESFSWMNEEDPTKPTKNLATRGSAEAVDTTVVMPARPALSLTKTKVRKKVVKKSRKKGRVKK